MGTFWVTFGVALLIAFWIVYATGCLVLDE
jgi:hypothetical protein